VFEDESRPNAWLNNVKRVPSTSYQPESKLPACLLNAIKPPETWRSCKTVLLRCTAGRSGENQASSNKNAKRCRQPRHEDKKKARPPSRWYQKSSRKHTENIDRNYREKGTRDRTLALFMWQEDPYYYQSASLHHFLSRCSRKTLRGNHKNITFPEPGALVWRLRSICYPGREDRNVGRFCI